MQTTLTAISWRFFFLKILQIVFYRVDMTVSQCTSSVQYGQQLISTSKSGPFYSLTKIGLQKCEMECKRWNKCASVNYDKNSLECYLNRIDETHSSAKLVIINSWTNTKRSSFENVSHSFDLFS